METRKEKDKAGESESRCQYLMKKNLKKRIEESG